MKLGKRRNKIHKKDPLLLFARKEFNARTLNSNVSCLKAVWTSFRLFLFFKLKTVDLRAPARWNRLAQTRTTTGFQVLVNFHGPAGRKKKRENKRKRMKKTKARRVVQTVLLEFKVEGEKQPKKTNKKERQNGCFKEKQMITQAWNGGEKTALIKLPGIIWQLLLGPWKCMWNFTPHPATVICWTLDIPKAMLHDRCTVALGRWRHLWRWTGPSKQS